MLHESDYDANWDLDTLKQADEIKKDPKRMTAIRKAAEDKMKLAKKLTSAKKTASPNFQEDGFVRL